jgi:hypothetical protein
VAIRSYFYDSVTNDRPYSAQDFSTAFGMAFETGCLIRETVGGTFGFDIGGTNYTTLYEGKAIVEGHFVEIPEGTTETLVVPAGSYSGQVVIQVDIDGERIAKIVVKQDRTPIQSASFYELPLWDVTVVNNVITAVVDKRYQGGAVPNNHNQSISTIEGLQALLDEKVRWSADPNGVRAIVGRYNGTGKNVVLFLTSARPSADPTEHRVWIQIDNF